MRISFELQDRTAKELKEFCKFNGIAVGKYLHDIVERQFNIDRFGDLNEKLGSKKEIKEPVAEKVPEVKAVKKVETKDIDGETVKSVETVSEHKTTDDGQPKKVKRTLKVR